MMKAKLVLLAGFLALTTVDGAEQINARAVFAQLQTLVGDWEGKTEKGRALKVSYRLTANNTVLIETWTLGPGRESLTLYHMDNENLIATHYCPVGNQPRLRFKEGGSASLFAFEFVSATNLAKPEAAHQHRFEMEFLDANSFARSETYLENGKGEPERIAYTRTNR
ncbi:MAG TPA: hypothetical protein VNP98_13110 [Chthoniobacterales bacterium]|nr:hypothetical protein [Chthoniobacterales bacterium]